MDKTLTVIIPTYNRMDALPKVLAGLRAQREELKNAEVIIVDDGSTDQTQNAVKEFIGNSGIETIYLKQENCGAGRARNFGIKKSRAEIILFLDSDIIPCQTLIREHLEFHRKYPQEHFALRGSVKMEAGQQNTVRFTQVCDLKHTGKTQSDDEYIQLCWADFRSNNISLKKKFLLENGLFDEDMSAYQDTELGHRLGKKGLVLFHSNKASATHLHPVNRQQYFGYAEKYGKSLAVWCYKHPELKGDLKKIKLEERYGFLSFRNPVLTCKYALRSLLVNAITVKLVVLAGSLLEKAKIGTFKYFYRKAYQYYQKDAFLKQRALIDRGDIKINKTTKVSV